MSLDNTYLAQVLNFSSIRSISQPINKIAKQAYQLVTKAHHEYKKNNAKQDKNIECLEIEPELFARKSSQF